MQQDKGKDKQIKNKGFMKKIFHIMILMLACGQAVWGQECNNPDYSSAGNKDCENLRDSWSANGTEIGNFRSVPIYGNSKGEIQYYDASAHEKKEDWKNYVDGFYTGMRWQCVEFVTRYYYIKYGLDIKRNVNETGNGKDFYDDVVNKVYSRGGIIAFPNGGSIPPEVGDILGFKDIREEKAGHVAIISAVGDNYIELAQQNSGYKICPVGWRLSYNKNTNIIRDGVSKCYHVQGWLRAPYEKISSGVEIIIGSDNEDDRVRTITLNSEGIQSLNAGNAGEKIKGIWLDNVQKYPSKSDGYSYFEILDIKISNDKAQIKLRFPKIDTHKPWNFRIQIAGDDGKDRTYYGEEQVIYAQAKEQGKDFTDIAPNAWYWPYISDGLKYGLFKGAYNINKDNKYTFNPNASITRAEFAKIVVSAAVNLGILQIDISGKAFVATDKWYFPYMQTLYNKEVISQARPDDPITAGEMSKIICKVFNLNTTDRNVNTPDGVKVKNSLIVVDAASGDEDVQESMLTLCSIVDWTRERLLASGAALRSQCEPIATGMFPQTTNNYIAKTKITGINYVTRAIMAKVMTNIYEYYKNHKFMSTYNTQMLRSVQTKATRPSNITIIGDKFESTGNVSGQPMSSGTLVDTVLIPGQSIVIDKFKNIVGDIFFYWSVNGGTLEDLAKDKAHNMVKFTAPNNISSTETYDLYMYAGNSQGRYIEAFGKITVKVNNSITRLDAPTNLYIGNTGVNYFYVHWNNADWNSVTKYVIQSATNSSFTQNVQEDTKTGGEASRAVMRGPGTYYIRIKAVNTALGLESAWSNTISYTFNPYLVLDITDSYLTANVQGNSVTLNWRSAGGREPRYNLYFSDWNPFGKTPVLENTTATSYTVNNLNYNTTYYWGVKVTDSQGGEDRTNVVSFTTAASTIAPTGSITINYGETTTNSTLVNLQISAQAASGTIDKMQLSNDGTNWTDWTYYTTNKVWSLSEFGGVNTPGVKTVYVRFKDNSGNISTVCTDNIMLENTAPGYFYVRDLKTASLRTAVEYAQAGDNIYATAGYFDLSDEITPEIGGTSGATLKQGVNLIGEGTGKTTLYWKDVHVPFESVIYTYYGLRLEGDNMIDGLTIVTPEVAESATTAQSIGNGVFIRGKSNITIQNCEFKNSSRALFIQTYNGTPTNITLQNCLIHDMQHSGAIHTSGEVNSFNIFNNTIYNNSISSIYIMNGNNIKVKNNIVMNNRSHAINIGKDYIANLSFTNNNVWNNRQNDGIPRPYDNYDNSDYSLRDQTGINGNISVNPQFDNAFHLQSGSPCINTGVNVGLPYAGSAPDMGAYETNLPTGSLTIQSNITAQFVVSKPDRTTVSVSSGQNITNLPQGIYGIYPQQTAGCYTPQPIITKVSSGNNSVQINYYADTQAPQGRIYLNAGDFFTHSRYISIYNDISDEVNGLGNGAKMQFSNDGVTWSAQEPLSSKKLLWDLGSYGGNLNEGDKVIHAKFCDAGGNWSDVITDTIRYIPNGRIIVANPDKTYTGRTDGDIFLLKDGQYYMYYLGGSSIRQKIKIQGLDKNAKINGGTLYEPIKFDNITLNNLTLYSKKSTFTNIVLTNGYLHLSSKTGALIANSILTGEQNPTNNIINVGAFDATLDCYNNVVKGKGSETLSDAYLSGIHVLANRNGETIRVRNNIIMDFMSDSYSGAIVVQRNDMTYGNVEISNNNFYNNKVDVANVRLLVENIQPYNIAPDFISDGSYRLQPNSQLRNLGSDKIIHRNHDGSKNTLGIEGGLFYNTVPTVNAVITQKAQLATLDASTSYDAQTPCEYLQYRWDYNNDGVFDTEFLLTPTHDVNINQLGDTIVGWVFDEHFSMNYIKIAKTDIHILPEDTKLALSVEAGTYCAGSTVVAQPAVTGNFESDNLFAMELSDKGGTFNSPTTLDYFSGTTITEAQIALAIPANAETGNYKLRLKSSNPVIYSEPSKSFSVNASPQPVVTISANRQDICAGASVTFGASVQNAGNGKSYQWYVNDFPVGANSPVFSTNTLQNGDVVKMKLTCTSGCYFPTVAVSNEISMRVNSMQTPYVEIITSYYDNPQAGDPVDLFAYVENAGDNITYEWYVNSVLTGGNEPFITVNYTPNTTVRVKVFCNADCLENNYVEASYSFSGETSGIKAQLVKHLSIYPNPAKDYLFIQTDLLIEKIEICDLSGKCALKTSVESGKINVSALPHGVYILKVYTDSGWTVGKIIKE